MSVRERSRLRPQLLERLGWRYMPLWTIEVFTDPSACADRIGWYLGLENHIAQSASAHHGFLHADEEQLNPGNARSLLVDGTGDQFDREPHSDVHEAENAKEAPLMDQEIGTGDSAGQESGESATGNSAEDGADAKSTATKTGSNGILPTKAAEDDPRRWGDDSGYDHEQWLKEQKPPHWG